MESQPRLERSISLPVFVAYGVGTMVGAGYYALLGEVAGIAGLGTPVAFGVAELVAYFSASSFGALGARYPSSAGPARYVTEGLGAWLGPLVGWLVIATGVVSAAALSRAFARFLGDLAPVPETVAIVGLMVVLGGVAAWGIRASTRLAVTITVIELGGLVWVAAVTFGAWGDLPGRLGEISADVTAGAGSALFAASFLSFYAFVGFEDMVTLAEELEEPRRNLPRGVTVALVLTTVIYVVVATSAVLAVPPEALAESNTPMARLVGDSGGAVWALTVISLLTGVNGALVQVVMASRVLYGLARQGGAPAVFARVHPRRRTPLAASVAAVMVVLVLALTLDLVELARVTSAVILVVFALVNLALVQVQARERAQGGALPGFPNPGRWRAVLGAVTCVALLAASLA